MNWRQPSRFQCLKYLKHCGKMIDVKVTIAVVNKFPMIYIRDTAFLDYKRALQYLRHIAETELIAHSLSEGNLDALR